MIMFSLEEKWFAIFLYYKNNDVRLLNVLTSMQLGVDTVPVLVGPVSYLLLSKAAKGVEKSFSLLSLLGSILPI